MKVVSRREPVAQYVTNVDRFLGATRITLSSGDSCGWPSLSRLASPTWDSPACCLLHACEWVGAGGGADEDRIAASRGSSAGGGGTAAPCNGRCEVIAQVVTTLMSIREVLVPLQDGVDTGRGGPEYHAGGGGTLCSAATRLLGRGGLQQHHALSSRLCSTASPRPDYWLALSRLWRLGCAGHSPPITSGPWPGCWLARHSCLIQALSSTLH